ncbi:hypothetical protein ZHAS_00018009 [Anopheles sinensis]|uniref:Uncharacterized protein n=1 Tax=Anopheles sinensis TaxID=74873 RepID=A0A084WIC7_ANOSI|nr:hypothetical protein ZHAS_00018009 [Anopheles sinensis]
MSGTENEDTHCAPEAGRPRSISRAGDTESCRCRAISADDQRPGSFYDSCHIVWPVPVALRQGCGDENSLIFTQLSSCLFCASRRKSTVKDECVGREDPCVSLQGKSTARAEICCPEGRNVRLIVRATGAIINRRQIVNMNYDESYCINTDTLEEKNTNDSERQQAPPANDGDFGILRLQKIGQPTNRVQIP